MTTMNLIDQERLPGRYADLVGMYMPRAIRGEREYDEAQGWIDRLVGIAHPTRGQREYLDTLTVLLEDYERRHESWGASDISPLDTLRALMEDHQMSASDLGRILGDRSLGTRVLSGERKLSKAHIRKLAEHFAVSPALFLE
jgi:HTH-type transcriptional regulator / antitoxin HigA